LRDFHHQANFFQVMTPDIRKLVHAVPFVPFTVHLADGGQLRVPTVGHVAVPPAGGRVFIFGDDERYDIISSLLISRITVDRESAPPRKNQ
jgi:hypothetical protein